MPYIKSLYAHGHCFQLYVILLIVEKYKSVNTRLFSLLKYSFFLQKYVYLQNAQSECSLLLKSRITYKMTIQGNANNVGKFKRMLVWLGRIGHSRGFGVQSPWAYRMVRYVINEHYPYYAYDTLELSYPGLSVVERKLCELSLRLANSVQPSLIVNFDDAGGAYEAYFRAGCRKARIDNADSGLSPVRLYDTLKGCGGRFVVRLVPGKGLSDLFTSACGAARAGSAVMVHGIHSDRNARNLWRRIVREEPGIVTFDLYYCGLVFFDEKRYKQNYIINF